MCLRNNKVAAVAGAELGVRENSNRSGEEVMVGGVE